MEIQEEVLMKKLGIVTILLALVLALGACTGGAPSEAASGEETAGSTVTMATEATFPPYEYMSGTDVVGVDVDIANEIAKAMGAELVIEEMPFDSVIAAVNTGKVDFAASGLSITEERQQQVDFSIEYATSKQVIMTKADSGIEGDADLDGKTAGVQMGTVADLALTDDYPGVTVERYNKYTDAVNDLINGRLDAIVLDSLPAEELKTMGDDLIICENELFTDVYAIAVQKGNTELLDTINTVLQQLIDEGKIEEFTQNHLS